MITPKALEWIEGQADQMATDLETLCNINSGSDHVEGLERAANWLENYFTPLGVPCQRILFPPYSQLDDLGQLVNHFTGPALRWDWQGSTAAPDPDKEPNRILMTIHYDTVYSLQDSFQACTRLDGNRMRGPGVIDAKGGLVVLRYAALAANEFLSESPLRFSVVLTPDEEIGSPASSQLWKEIHDQFRFALLFEPAMADGCLVSHRKGTGSFVFCVEGRSAHSGRNFDAGRNAIVHAAAIACELHQLNGQREHVTVNVGRIRGGNAVNVVPDFTTLRVNVRVSSREDQDWVETQVQQLVQKYHRPEEGYRVHVDGGIYSPPKTIEPSVEQLMRWVEEEAAKLNQPVRWKGSGGASDGNKLQALGLPNIDTLGPEGDGLHSDQEWVDLASLSRKACLVYQLLARFSESLCSNRQSLV
jgi:glutamate carboxypeptidase